jgi:hypothetical protein
LKPKFTKKIISGIPMKNLFYYILASLFLFSCSAEEEDEGLNMENFGFQKGEVKVSFSGTTATGVVFENETFTFDWYNLLTQNAVSISNNGTNFYITIERYDSPYSFEGSRNYCYFELNLNNDPNSDNYEMASGNIAVFIDELIDNQNLIRFSTYNSFTYNSMIFSQFNFNKDTFELSAKGQYIDEYSSESDPVVVTMEINVQLFKIIKNSTN